MDDPKIVMLLKEYAFEESITRPEAGVIIGKTLGQVAGIHNRNVAIIGPWPTLNPIRKKNRGCQYPIGTPGTTDFDLCGKPRTSEVSPVCEHHKGKIWKSH